MSQDRTLPCRKCAKHTSFRPEWERLGLSWKLRAVCVGCGAKGSFLPAEMGKGTPRPKEPDPAPDLFGEAGEQ